MTARTVGQVARTPKQEVHREGCLRSIRYASQSSERAASARPPVVLVYSFINRPTVLDLVPGRSVVESLLASDLDVYLVDWGDPTRAESGLDLGGHAARLERALSKAARMSGTTKVQVLGYCLGGTMALVLGVLAPSLIERIGLLATPVVFEAGGTLAIWAKTPTLEPSRMALTEDGNVPGELLRETFRWLDPMGQLRKWITLAERAEDEDFVDLFVAQERWVSSCVDFPGRLFEDLLGKLYGEDLLARGELEVAGQKIDLQKLEGPVLNIYSSGDTIVPEDATVPLAQLAPRVTNLKVPGGHIGMTVGRRAPETTHRELARFYADGNSNI